MNIKKIALSLFAGVIGASVLTVSSMATAFVSEDIEGVAGIAKIGDVEYMTLQAAVNASKDGDEIKLVDDVSQKDGVTITDKKLTINLNGNSFAVSEGSSTNSRNLLINGNSDVVIKNGTLIADGELNSGTYGTVRTEGTANVVLDDLKLYNYRGNGLNIKALGGTTVTVTDTEIYSTYGGGIESAGGEIELTNVTVEQKGMWSAPYNSMAISVNGGGTVTVNSGTYTTEPLAAADAYNQGTSHGSWAAGVLNSGGTLIINDGTFANGNYGDDELATAPRGLIFADKGGNLVVNGGTFNALGYIFDLQNNLGTTPNPSAAVCGGVFSADPRKSATSYNSNLIKFAEDCVIVEYSDGGYAVVGKEFIGNEKITVDFVDVTDDKAEGEKIYNINLVADTEKIINRLNSADLTFVLNVDSGEIDYEIVDIADDNIVINPVDNSKNRYEFHFETKTDVTNDTDDVITIAQVKFTGYGTFDFAVDTNANKTNAVHATEILDNIVDTYVPAGTTTDTTVGELVVADDITDITIKVPTRVLTINVDFPNSVEKNAVAYQQMTVKVFGGDLTKDIVIDLGDTAVESEAIDLENEKPEANFSVNVATADKYVVTVAKALTVNTSYNVEVSGEGYRTARYTVTMTDAKTLNFWNNVKDNDTLVEEKKDSSAKKVTFLAGDIVKDSLINIYDLSAVVSYFGETGLSADKNPTYAKYDLNRDGKIDSKDVAYVLVSWGK